MRHPLFLSFLLISTLHFAKSGCMEFPAGKITNYYRAIGVASVQISAPIAVGDKIHIKDRTTDFEQTAESIQIHHTQVVNASKGDIAGIKITDYVRKNDIVYSVEDKPVPYH